MSQLVLMGFLGNKAVSALTPLWLLGLGVLAGMALIALLWALLWVLTRILGSERLRRIPDELWTAVREGVLFHVLVVACILAGWGLIGTFLLRPPSESLTILQSLGRLARVGEFQHEAVLPASPQAVSEEEIVIPPVQAVSVMFRGGELQKLTVESSENVSMARDPDTPMDSLNTINVMADEPFTWQRRPGGDSPLGEEKVTAIYFRNRSPVDANLTLTVTTQALYPEVRVVLWAAGSVVGLFLLYFLQFTLMPRLSAIALATFKSQVAQPLFSLVIIIGVSALVIFIFIPYNTFGEDIKMLKDSGLTLIRVLGIFLAVWGASTTLAEEVENYTALTVLSKPIRRRSFVLGKFAGIAWTAALMFIILGTVLFLVTSLKVVYDARENSMQLPEWQAVFLQASSVIPGLALGYMETIILASLSVAISTRLPMFANFVICFTVYVLGHLTPLIVQVTDERFEIVKFVGQLIATVVPNLEAFDLQTAMAGGLAVPGAYLLWALLYSMLFSVIAMLLALLLFEDRDMA